MRNVEKSGPTKVTWVFKGVNTHINFPRNTGNILSQEVSFLNFQLHIFYIEALFVV